MKTVKRYIPEKVDEIIKASQFKNKEHLYIICDMIYRINNYRKEDKTGTNPFTDIPQNYFEDIIKDRINFQKAKNYLIDEQIIECDGISSANGRKALGYKFNDELVSQLVTVIIEKPTLVKNIINNKNSRNNFVNDSLKEYKDHFLNTFKIDNEKALAYIDNWYGDQLSKNNSGDGDIQLANYIQLTNKYNSNYMSISAIADGDLIFRRNVTNKRIDTNLTNLKKELKQFIKSNQPLYQIDIVNSQPFLLSIILSQSVENCIDKKELEQYVQWTGSGTFYENFYDKFPHLLTVKEKRGKIKEIMFCVFYSKNQSYKKEKYVFSETFPDIMQWINNQKIKSHNELAIRMQRFESNICIDVICDELNKNGIKYYTIHDAWLVGENDVEKTDSIVKNAFNRIHNSVPQFDCEIINPE